MSIHGATVINVQALDYSAMKKHILDLSKELKLRIVSGNGPIRTEGYKMTAFEMYEQMDGKVPDYIAVSTSACGHIRGLFKGYRELQIAGIINKLPKMIIVQAQNNSPIVTAIKEGISKVVPFSDFHTVAAITTGNPMGGVDINKFAKNIKQLIKIASKYSSKIVFSGLSPIDESKTNPIPWDNKMSYTNERIKEYDNIVKLICQKNNIYFINLFNELRKLDYRKLLEDGLHPNSIGYEKMFEIVRDFLIENQIVK